MTAGLPEVKLIGMTSETLLGADVIVCAGRHGQTDANDKGKGKLQECLHGVLLLGWEGISSNLKVKPVPILYPTGVNLQQRPATLVAGRIKKFTSRRMVREFAYKTTGKELYKFGYIR
jgi:hypothetical protein